MKLEIDHLSPSLDPLKMLNKTLVSIIITLIFLSCSVNSKTEQITSTQATYQFEQFSKEDLKEDLTILYNKLDSTHFNLYHKHSKQEFQAKHKGLMEGIKDSMNLFQFYYHVLPLFDMLEDAHSALIFPFDYTKEYEKQGGKFIPLEVFIREGLIYIKKNHSKQDIPDYAQVISINNIAVANILEKLALLANYERKGSEDQYMSYFFRRILFPLYGFDTHYEVLIQAPTGEKKLLTLEGITADLFHKERAPDYRYYTISDTIGIIDINRCEGRAQFASFCDSVFTELQDNNISNLVIDVRDNGGGSTFHGDTLFTYLTSNKFTQYGQVDMKLSPMVNNELDSIYFEKHSAMEETTRFNPKLFQGDVYMIANQNSFSSATLLAATFKCYKMGTLIGEETGGVEIFFDEPILMTLPHTGIRYLASYQLRYCPCGSSTNRGITPNIETNWDIEDQIKGVDTEMKLIQQLIKEKQTTTKK